jgi:hypothetical protein
MELNGTREAGDRNRRVNAIPLRRRAPTPWACDSLPVNPGFRSQITLASPWITICQNLVFLSSFFNPEVANNLQNRWPLYGVRWPDTALDARGLTRARPRSGRCAGVARAGRVRPRPSKAASGRRTPYRLILRGPLNHSERFLHFDCGYAALCFIRVARAAGLAFLRLRLKLVATLIVPQRDHGIDPRRLPRR